MKVRRHAHKNAHKCTGFRGTIAIETSIKLDNNKLVV